MWKIVRAEFEYSKTILIFAHIFVAAVWIAFVVQGWEQVDKSFPALRSSLVAATAILFLSNFTKLQREKRSRLYNVLPLARGRLAVARLIFIGIFWLEVTGLLAIAFVLRPSVYSHEMLFGFLALTGYVLTLNAMPFIFRDLRLSYNSKKRKLLMNIGWTIAVFLGYFFFMLFIFSSNDMTLLPEPLKIVIAGFSNFVEKSFSAIVFNLLGFGLSWISVLLFKKRMLFVE